ncbi:phage portal protein family protein [Thermophagus sp. OGC60D27]|uniref:phage portal protein family protein n=1 Tax=Thermophagus sp. OGC60D27 TaxID=3458415 RepID=UPI004037826B
MKFNLLNWMGKGNIDKTPINGYRHSRKAEKKSPDRIKMEMKNLRQAIEDALDADNPDRRDLISLYENAVQDSHVHAQIEIARNKIVSSPFILKRNGVVDEQATELLRREWFEKFLGYVLDSELWGYTLVEAGDMNDNGEFTDMIIFPRRNVLPFKRAICLDSDSPDDYIPYAGKDLTPEQFFFIELGTPDNLGSLRLITREVIWKNFARSDWSQASEKYGMPYLSIKTDTTDKAELDRIEAMARNFASNGYVITDHDDEVTIQQVSHTDFYKIYLENAQFCDEQISKCINGQTSSSDEKAFVGSAEVHERILNDFHSARLRRCTNVVNNKLIPFLIFHGYPLEGCRIEFLDLTAKDKEKNTTPQSRLLINGIKKKPIAASRNLPW